MATIIQGVLIVMASLAISALSEEAEAAGTRAFHDKLENGMEVVVIPDHRAPVVTHMVWYKVGAADEQAGQSGLAHFFEHLMFKGTEKIPPGQFSKIVAQNGGRDNAFTSQDATAYFQRIAKDRLGLVMEMEADRMRNLRLSEKDVVTEREVILEERRSRVDNDPGSVLSEEVYAALYRSHPYGSPVIGWAHEIAALDRASALAFYRRYYAPNNAILVVAGDVEPEEVMALAKRTYGKIAPVPDATRAPRPKEPPHRAARRVLLKDARAGRPTMQRLYLAPSYTTAEPGEAEAIDLLVKALASGATSRLYRRLVVEEKLAASAGGWYMSTALDYGRIGFYAIAADKNELGEIERILDEVIADVIENGLTAEELERAKNLYIADYVYESDSQSSLARRYGWGLVTGLTIADIEAWPERLRAVTLEDVKKVARKYLDIRRSVTGWLEPAPAHTARDGSGDASAAESKSKSKS